MKYFINTLKYYISLRRIFNIFKWYSVILSFHINPKFVLVLSIENPAHIVENCHWCGNFFKYIQKVPLMIIIPMSASTFGFAVWGADRNDKKNVSPAKLFAYLAVFSTVVRFSNHNFHFFLDILGINIFLVEQSTSISNLLYVDHWKYENLLFNSYFINIYQYQIFGFIWQNWLDYAIFTQIWYILIYTHFNYI